MRDFTIWLMRHGEIDHAYKGRLVGQRDVPLSEKGRIQALVFRNLASEVGLGSIHCSDLSRSYNTAEIIMGGLTIPLIKTIMLREISLGAWEGHQVKDIKEGFPDQWRDRVENIAEYRPSSGESFADLASRVIPIFESIVISATSDTLIVGHAGVNRVIICHVLGVSLDHVLKIGQDYGRMNVIQSRDGTLTLRAVNCPGFFND